MSYSSFEKNVLTHKTIQLIHVIEYTRNGYINLAEFSTGSAPALSKVTNPDGSFTYLLFEVHKYLDSDDSGTHADCISDEIDPAFAPMAEYLRENNRIALLAETGGVNDETCFISMSISLFSLLYPFTLSPGGFESPSIKSPI